MNDPTIKNCADHRGKPTTSSDVLPMPYLLEVGTRLEIASLTGASSVGCKYEN